MSASILLTGGTVYNSRAKTFEKRDVLIDEGRISEMKPASDSHSLDCSGWIISPGFIDCHGHSDDIPLIDCDGGSKLFDGVTTEICGNCGWSMFPNDGKPRNCGYRGEYRIGAENFSEYFEQIENTGIPINLGFLAGHGMLRNMVAGRDNRSVTSAEKDTMKNLLAETLDHGCLGLSLGLIYPPGCFSDPEEIVSLAEIIAERELILTAHIRNEGNTLLESLDEFLEPGRRTGVRTHVSHIKAMWPPNWYKIKEALDLINNERNNGGDISADRYPYTASSTGLDAVLPKGWFEGGNEATLSILAEKDSIDKLREHFITSFGDNFLSSVQFSDTSESGFEDLCGRRIHEIADENGEDDIECYIRILRETSLKSSAVFHGMKEENLAEIYSQDWVCVGSDSSYRSLQGITSSGVPHPRSYGSFSRFLSRYCGKDNRLDLEEGLSRITSLPADRFRLKNRGYLEPGFAADITVFNPETLKDNATFEQPHQYSEGIVHLFINGKHVIENGKLINSSAGRVIKST